MKLVIGNKNYSSWSLRAWLLLAVHGLDFEEEKVLLSQDSTAAAIAKFSKAGKVPVLIDGDILVWDSLSILEYVSEQYLDNRGWPQEAAARAEARSVAAEMHSCFPTLRGDMPMNCRARNRKVAISESLQKDIDRIDSLWSELRDKYKERGLWLFGDFSIADCMFAPVVFRFATYDVPVSPLSQEYMTTMLQHPAVRQWLEAAVLEEETIDSEEVG